MKHTVILKRETDNTFIQAIINANSPEDATKRAIDKAKAIAKGIKPSKIILPGVPLIVVSSEPWKDCTLKVVTGDKRFAVVLMSSSDTLEYPTLFKVGGYKSAYALAVKELRQQSIDFEAFVLEV